MPRPLLRRTPATALIVLVTMLLAGCGATGSSSTATPASTPSTAATGTSSAPTGTFGQYVALGDSYAAGVLIPTTDVAGGCFRSDHDYASLVARTIGATLHDVTCSAATTADFTGASTPGSRPRWLR